MDPLQPKAQASGQRGQLAQRGGALPVASPRADHFIATELQALEDLLATPRAVPRREGRAQSGGAGAMDAQLRRAGLPASLALRMSAAWTGGKLHVVRLPHEDLLRAQGAPARLVEYLLANAKHARASGGLITGRTTANGLAGTGLRAVAEWKLRANVFAVGIRRIAKNSGMPGVLVLERTVFVDTIADVPAEDLCATVSAQVFAAGADPHQVPRGAPIAQWLRVQQAASDLGPASMAKLTLVTPRATAETALEVTAYQAVIAAIQGAAAARMPHLVLLADPRISRAAVDGLRTLGGPTTRIVCIAKEGSAAIADAAAKLLVTANGGWAALQNIEVVGGRSEPVQRLQMIRNRNPHAFMKMIARCPLAASEAQQVALPRGDAQSCAQLNARFCDAFGNATKVVLVDTDEAEAAISTHDLIANALPGLPRRVTGIIFERSLDSDALAEIHRCLPWVEELECTDLQLDRPVPLPLKSLSCHRLTPKSLGCLPATLRTLKFMPIPSIEPDGQRRGPGSLELPDLLEVELDGEYSDEVLPSILAQAPRHLRTHAPPSDGNLDGVRVAEFQVVPNEAPLRSDTLEFLSIERLDAELAPEAFPKLRFLCLGAGSARTGLPGQFSQLHSLDLQVSDNTVPVPQVPGASRVRVEGPRLNARELRRRMALGPDAVLHIVEPLE